MKGPSFYFQKMSLTRQILTIILTVLMFFIMFFFVFVSDNIDRTITKQMCELILNRQTPIVGLVDSKQTDSIDDIYAFLASDSVLTNCIIKDGKKTYPTIKTYDICSPCFEEFKKFIEEVKQ